MMKKKEKRFKIDGYLRRICFNKKEADDLIINARNVVFK